MCCQASGRRMASRDRLMPHQGICTLGQRVARGRDLELFVVAASGQVATPIWRSSRSRAAAAAGRRSPMDTDAPSAGGSLGSLQLAKVQLARLFSAQQILTISTSARS